MSRRRLDAEQSKTLILDAVERLLRRDGYAVVNTRSVAIEAGVRPTLVHYHFDTTENLLLESYRRSALRSEEMLAEALQSPRPLRALWHYTSDSDRTVLATQFMALANLRPGIRHEMRDYVEKHRRMQASVLEGIAAQAPPALRMQAEVLAMLIAALGRAFVMETSIGISLGHDGMRRQVAALLDVIEPSDGFAS